MIKHWAHIPDRPSYFKLRGNGGSVPPEVLERYGVENARGLVFWSTEEVAGALCEEVSVVWPKAEFLYGAVEPTMGKAQGAIYLHAARIKASSVAYLSASESLIFAEAECRQSGYYDESSLTWIKSRLASFCPLFPKGVEVLPPFIDAG